MDMAAPRLGTHGNSRVGARRQKQASPRQRAAAARPEAGMAVRRNEKTTSPRRRAAPADAKQRTALARTRRTFPLTRPFGPPSPRWGEDGAAARPTLFSPAGRSAERSEAMRGRDMDTENRNGGEARDREEENRGLAGPHGARGLGKEATVLFRPRDGSSALGLNCQVFLDGCDAGKERACRCRRRQLPAADRRNHGGERNARGGKG